VRLYIATDDTGCDEPPASSSKLRSSV
jgi:hypothetical protein